MIGDARPTTTGEQARNRRRESAFPDRVLAKQADLDTNCDAGSASQWEDTMRRYTGWLMITVMAFAVVACSTQTSSGSGARSSTAANAPADGVPAPPSSPLSKIQLGMTKRQVSDILGHASDENSYMTGKVFIPFYFGNDARRTCWYYKGMGRVVFADGNAFGGGGSEVVRVDYDPAESGVAQ